MKDSINVGSQPAIVKYDAAEIGILARTEARRLRRLAEDGAIVVPIGPGAWARFLECVADLADDRAAESPLRPLAA
jgi:hypothetical protein